MYEREKKTASVKLNMTMEDMVRNIFYFPKESAKEYQCVESSLEKITEKQLTLKLLLSFYTISIFMISNPSITLNKSNYYF